MVILLHGIWMPSRLMFYLGHHAARAGFAVRYFHYRSRAMSMAQIIERLHDLVNRCDADEVHLIGHSMGGIVALHYLQRHPKAPPGRVVLLGTPVVGSRVAQNMSRTRIGSWLLSEAAASLCHPGVVLPDNRDIGMIAGTLPLGMGLFFGGANGVSDGAVHVDETRLPGLRDHLTLHASHSGLLFSPSAARQAMAFLKTGRFDHQA